jgi:hypothetical protein
MNIDSPSTDQAACPWFPDVSCDEMCQHIGCGCQGLLIHMQSQGVPEAEIGGSPDFIPE